MIASKADIIAYESLGFSHLVWRGDSYFVNLDSDSSRLKFKEYLENETGKEWEIDELERYVFYRKDMYNLVFSSLGNNRLEINDTFRGKIEVPINAISCEYMFSCKNLEGIDFSEFDSSGVEDMRYMFANCTFPEGFSLGDRFDTSSVKNMYGMFSDTQFNEGFNLGNKFDTSKVKDIHGMFRNCTFPEGFSLGDRFDTSKVKDMGFMFNYAQFNEGFSLGDKFDTSNVENMCGMFSGCTFSEGFSLGDKFDTSKVEDMSDMFTTGSLPSRVTKQLSNRATAEEIVELLKSSLVTKADFF